MTDAEEGKTHNHTISRRTAIIRLSGLLGVGAIGSVLASCQSLAQQPATPTQITPTTSSRPTTGATATTPATSPGTTLYVYRGHTSAVSDVSWSPDSSALASASGGIPFDAGENALHVWNASSGKNAFILQNPPNGTPPTVALVT